MCTGVGWIYRCRQCLTAILKDTNVSGHTCHEAKRIRQRGCCRSGVEYTFFDKVSDELCILCEIADEVRSLDARTCGEAGSVLRRGYYSGIEDEDEEMQEDWSQEEWSEWVEESSSDDGISDEEGEYTGCYSGTTDVSRIDEDVDDDDDDNDDEDGGALLLQEEDAIKTEIILLFSTLKHGGILPI
ncbi:hypothetical protein F4781DRAFT_403281 [Annulohypoxylon bovei var. microspora]|nr:hypothetical protein F4781DRAFT_403281 [Annulohypoxylon bovei var. microspora]